MRFSAVVSIDIEMTRFAVASFVDILDCWDKVVIGVAIAQIQVGLESERYSKYLNLLLHVNAWCPVQSSVPGFS